MPIHIPNDYARIHVHEDVAYEKRVNTGGMVRGMGLQTEPSIYLDIKDGKN